MRLFRNRIEAAEELASALEYLKPERPIVLGLANGGVPLADVIARTLESPLDVMLIEKLESPAPPHHVVGAVDEHGRISMIKANARWHHVNSQQLIEPARHKFRDLQRRQGRLRALLPELDVRGRCVIVVGQGIVSGAKMLGAVASLKDRGAAKVVAAAPAGSTKATWQLHEAADMVVIPHRPAADKTIDQLYKDFVEITDDLMLAIVDKWVSNRPIAETPARTITMRVPSTLGLGLMCDVDLPSGMAKGGGPYPAVVFAHGFESDSNSVRSLTISRRLAQRGIIGVRMNFTGHGRSEGSMTQATDAQMLCDLRTVTHAVAHLAEVDASRIGLVGSGTGAMIALYLAAQTPEIKAMVIRGPVCGREVEAAHRVKAPTLLIHAERDTALKDAIETLDRELPVVHQLLRIPESNRLFSDPISLEMMVSATVDWLVDHLTAIPKSGDLKVGEQMASA